MRNGALEQPEMSQKFVTFWTVPVSRLLINILFYYCLLLRRVCSVRTGDSAEYDDVGNRAGSDAVIAVNAAGPQSWARILRILCQG